MQSVRKDKDIVTQLLLPCVMFVLLMFGVAGCQPIASENLPDGEAVSTATTGDNGEWLWSILLGDYNSNTPEEVQRYVLLSRDTLTLKGYSGDTIYHVVLGDTLTDNCYQVVYTKNEVKSWELYMWGTEPCTIPQYKMLYDTFEGNVDNYKAKKQEERSKSDELDSDIAKEAIEKLDNTGSEVS